MDERNEDEKKDHSEKGEVFYRAYPMSESIEGTTNLSRSAYFLVEKILMWLTGVIEFILLLRIVVAAFGATGVNALTAFVYDASEPLVAPFFGLFGTTSAVTNSRFEFETLVAMVVYYIIAYIVVQLMDLFRGTEEQ